jgi:hypothetical protein
LLCSGTSHTTVGIVSEDRTQLAFGASTTGLSACLVLGPTRDLAVDRTSERAAVRVRRKGKTHNATVGNVGDDGAGLRLGTKAARLGASAVAGPGRKYTINRAGESVATGAEGSRGASNTTVLHLGNDRTRLGLGASATGLGASAVASPAGDLAVNGAPESVATGGG